MPEPEVTFRVHYHVPDDKGRMVFLCCPGTPMTTIDRATGIPWLVRCNQCRDIMKQAGISLEKPQFNRPHGQAEEPSRPLVVQKVEMTATPGGAVGGGV